MPDQPDTPDTASDEPPTSTSAPSPSATRDLLANERTLLAWGRTAVAIMGLGFVVARFGLFIRELANIGARPVPSGLSTAFGVVLVICGMALLILSWLRYRLITDDILHNRFRWDSRLGALLTGILVLAGILLAIYLLMTA